MQTLLEGPIDPDRLREALRRIAERNQAFFLVGSDGISERLFYFAIGGVRVIGSGPRRSPTLGQVLVERGDLTPEAAERVESACDGEPDRFAEMCSRMQAVSPEALRDAVESQVEDELLDLFFWEGAEMSLVEGLPPKSFYEGKFQTAAVTCEVARLLQRILERCDAWRDTVTRLPSGRDVFELTEKAAPDLAGRHARLFRQLDGTRTSAEAIDRSQMPRVPAFEVLMVAVSKGRVRRVTGSAAQRASREVMLRDIELLEQALRVRVDSAVVRRRLARALETVGEAARSGGQWRELGDHHRKRNEIDRALQCYAECVRVMPTDFATRELMIEIHRQRGEADQVVAHGRVLSELLLRYNLLNRAKHLLLQLAGLRPDDAGLRRQLVLVLIGLGERDQALRQLRDLARMLEARKAAPSELRDVYVRILALEPRDPNARRRLDEVTGVAAQRRMFRIAGAATAACVAACAGWYFLESRARSEIAVAMREARAMVGMRDLDGAKARIEAALAAHPFAGATQPAHSFLARVEQLQRERQERASRRAIASGHSGPDDAAQRRAQVESTAREMTEQAARLQREQRPQEANRIYRELFAVHATTDAAASAKIPMVVEATPAEATILCNGSVVGHGTAIVEYNPLAPATLEVELEHFQTDRRVLDGVQPERISVLLHRPIRWTATFDAAVDAPPLVRGGVVYVAGRDRFLTALSAADGKPLWSVPLGLYSDASVPPVEADGRIVVATATGEAVAVDPATGAVAWRRRVGPGVERPAIAASGAVLVPATDGSLAALAPSTGEPAWTRPAGTLAGGAPAILADGRVGWVDPRGTLAACDAATGAPSVLAPTTAVLRGTPVAGPDDRLWSFAEDGSLRLLTASAGTSLRRFSAARAFPDTPPVADGDHAWVVGIDGTLTCYRADGETVFRRRLPETAPSGLAHASGRLYVAGSAGTLFVVDAATGRDLWRFAPDAGPISCAPVVRDGTVYVATARGRLFALEE